MRTSARAAVICVTAFVAMAGLAPVARAETAYRYWTYWSVESADWHFATIGPSSHIPVDGSVEGWRFAVTTQRGSAQAAPDSDPATAFARLCGATAEQPGMKRIALVVDFGMPEDAPVGERSPADLAECIVAAEDASGYEVLRSVTDVRVEDGLVCGIDSYPLVECADVVDAPAAGSTGASSGNSVTGAIVPESIRQASESTSPAGPLITGLVLLVAAAIGYSAWRRRERP